MNKISIQFNTASGGTRMVVCTVPLGYVQDGCLMLHLDTESNRVKAIPLTNIACIDFEEADDNAEVVYDKA